MSEYNEGDLVEAVKGEQLVRGRIFIPTGAERQFLGECGERVVYYEKNGFTLTVIEKAKPKFPTEPGLYVGGPEVHRLFDNGNWDDLGWGTPDENSLPLLFVEPRAVTAKAVLDEVGKFAWADGFTAQIEATAKKFGVRSNA